MEKGCGEKGLRVQIPDADRAAGEDRGAGAGADRGEPILYLLPSVPGVSEIYLVVE